MKHEVPPPIPVSDKDIEDVIAGTRERMEEYGTDDVLGMSIRLSWDLAHALKEAREQLATRGPTQDDLDTIRAVLEDQAGEAP